MREFLTWLRHHDIEIHEAFDARSQELTGRPLGQLADDELRACLEEIRADLAAALSSPQPLAGCV
jgi:hypothetical protein